MNTILNFEKCTKLVEISGIILCGSNLISMNMGSWTLKIPMRICYIISRDLTVRIFGEYSLLVLVK